MNNGKLKLAKKVEQISPFETIEEVGEVPRKMVGKKENDAVQLQDPFLNAIRIQNVHVSIYLVSGVKLQGTIISFDRYVVLLHNAVTQMVYKHAISTIVPVKNVVLDSDRGSF